ncbi:M91 family zinc metallopeptidase [Xanthomonas arboricola]|uniref:M91 family zinc metallopeptidase n=1 Tax=Xanthomonas arboricola TaxID=56448 RepID=UPI004040A926
MSNTPRDQDRFNAEVNVHLDHLNSRPIGNQLLDKLQQLSGKRRHKVTIHEIAPPRKSRCRARSLTAPIRRSS